MAGDNGQATAEAIKTLSDLMGRASIAGKLGQSFGGKRELYEQLGWPKVLKFEDYRARFRRDGIARRVVRLPVQGTWGQAPTLHDDDDRNTETPFEQDIEALNRRLGLFAELANLDRKARLGRFAVMLLGVDGISRNDQLAEPLQRAGRVLYLKSYDESRVEIKSFEKDPTSPRFGLPLMYTIQIGESRGGGSVSSVNVHHSRLVHVAEEADENDVYGTPALEPVFNYLAALELVVGGSAEMFWKGAFPGRALIADADAQWDESQTDDMKDQLDEFEHGLRRMLRLKGVTPHDLAVRVANPQHHASVLLDLIAGATGIPKRLLVGSERGELASSQDKATFASLVKDRQLNHAEPNVLRPTADRLIEVGLVRPPRDGTYETEWPDTHEPSDREKAETMKTKGQALRQFFGPMTESVAGGAIRGILEGLGIDPESVELAELEEVGEPPEDEPADDEGADA